MWNAISNAMNNEIFFNIFTCIIASGALALSMIMFLRGRKEAKSRFFLEQASKGLEEVVDLLRDQNNNRGVWVRATRTLLKTKNLKKKIHLQEYLDGFEAVEERVRNELYTILTIVDKETGERNSLPPQFFYGIKNWREIETLDEAAIQASCPPEVHDVTIDKALPAIKHPQLVEETVVAIFDFIKYPKDYSDPLLSVTVNLWGNNWERTWNESQGAKRYVAHRALKSAIGGKLYERQQEKEE